jgi:hypothetical protein
MNEDFLHIGYFPFCTKESVVTQAFKAKMPLRAAMYLFWKAKTLTINANISYIRMITGRFQILDPELYGPVQFSDLSYTINQTSNFWPPRISPKEMVCVDYYQMSASISQLIVAGPFQTGYWNAFIVFFSQYDFNSNTIDPEENVVPRVMAEDPSSISNGDDLVEVNFYLNAQLALPYAFYTLQNKPISGADQIVQTKIETTIGTDTFELDATTSVGNWFYNEFGYLYNPNLSQSIAFTIV